MDSSLKSSQKQQVVYLSTIENKWVLTCLGW